MQNFLLAHCYCLCRPERKNNASLLANLVALSSLIVIFTSCKLGGEAYNFYPLHKGASFVNVKITVNIVETRRMPQERTMPLIDLLLRYDSHLKFHSV